MKISIWCRHKDDNIIGVGTNIPWNVPSDSRRFRKLTENKTLVVGKKTYESFPDRTLPNRRIIVLTSDKNYEVSDKNNHHTESKINNLKNFPEDLYICGGAAVYDAFFTGSSLSPEIVIDCVYNGELLQGLNGDPVAVSKSVEVMQNKYYPLPTTYELDNVKTTVWLQKGSFIEQKTLKEILTYLEREGTE
jgi:hypothetical protein